MYKKLCDLIVSGELKYLISISPTIIKINDSPNVYDFNYVKFELFMYDDRKSEELRILDYTEIEKNLFSERMLDIFKICIRDNSIITLQPPDKITELFLKKNIKMVEEECIYFYDDRYEKKLKIWWLILLLSSYKNTVLVNLYELAPIIYK